MKRRLFARILISLIGAAFIFWGSMSAALGIFGEKTTAVITHIRREGGERAEVLPNRYTYNISYTFTLSDGKEINGFVKKIGSPVYVKADGTSKIEVKFLKTMPYINTAEETSILKTLILIGAGFLLVVVMNRKKSK